MYLKHFGLSELPFKITPDPRFLWYSDQHKEAKAKIEYHLSQKDGPIYLSADVGLGKTSIAQRLRDEFSNDKSKKVVLAFAPNLRTANQFIRFIAEEFDVKTARSYADTLKNFERYLIEQCTMQARNVQGTLGINGDVPSRPVLLVDDIIDSRWTLTIAGFLLQESGSGVVYPFTLARAQSRYG